MSSDKLIFILGIICLFVPNSVCTPQNGRNRTGKYYGAQNDFFVSDSGILNSPSITYMIADSPSRHPGSGGPIIASSNAIYSTLGGRPFRPGPPQQIHSNFDYGPAPERPKPLIGYSPEYPSYANSDHQSYIPYYGQPQGIDDRDPLSSIYDSLLAQGFMPGKPPISLGWSESYRPAPPPPPPPPPESNYGWVQAPPPPQTSYPNPPPPPQMPTNPGPSPGWGPIPGAQSTAFPSPQPTVPEFSYQFSLKPSAFGWETSYNVPCGNYKIQPRVKAHLRLATQALLPVSNAQSSSSQGHLMKRSARNPDVSQNDPLGLHRTLQFSPYAQQQFSVSRPTFRPRKCRWNFTAVNGCQLNFKCSWFQLPALFRCEENSLFVYDYSILLEKTFCGNRRPRSIYTSSTGRLQLTFNSEGAALPAIFDCTVICAVPGEGDGTDPLTSPFRKPPPPSGNTSEAQRTTPPSSINSIIASNSKPSQNSLATSSSNRTITVVGKPKPLSRPQLRMGNCKCGVPDSHYLSKAIHGRIVGGSSTLPGESPWTAALVKKNSNRPYCGASLINSRFLLTAGHCVTLQTRKPRNNGNHTESVNTTTTAKIEDKIHFEVLLNEHDLNDQNEIAGGTIRAKVDLVIVHPLYDNVTFDYDAALLRLAVPLEFNPPEPNGLRAGALLNSKGDKRGSHRFIHGAFDFHSLIRRSTIQEIEAREIPPKPVPICLPDTPGNGKNGRQHSIPAPDDYALVTGWGLTAEGGTPSNEMLKARVKIFNDSVCRELYKKHNYVITDRMVCAGYINGRTDSCVGDSGSPLVMQDENGIMRLMGAVSWGRGCGRKQLPGVYTKVTELMDWIYDEAAKDNAIWCT